MGCGSLRRAALTERIFGLALVNTHGRDHQRLGVTFLPDPWVGDSNHVTNWQGGAQICVAESPQVLARFASDDLERGDRA